jgi:hypothetical protein
MARYSDTILDQNNVPIVGALIAVKNQDGSTPALTDDGGQVLLNPLTSDSYGAYYFNGPANFYDEEYFYGGRLIRKNYGITVGVVTLPTGFIVDALGSSTTIAPSQRAVTDAVNGLDPRITTLETEIDALQGTVTSGRREYATYASAVSDAATPVLYPAVTLGQVAEVPLTDAGTHTDPVVGGTVNNSGIFRWSVSPAGWQRIANVDAVSAAADATAAAASASAAAASAASLSGIVPQLSEDSLVGARETGVLPAALAATVSGTHFTLSTSGATIPVSLTGDQFGDTTTTVNAIVQIVTGSAGTAFTVALGRWINAAGAQIGGDVSLTKTATQISFTGTQPAGARRFDFVLIPPATTTCRFPIYQFGTPARPTTDSWYLSLLGAGVANNDPTPLAFTTVDANWNPLTGRVTVPASAGGSFGPSVPSGVNDGDVVWVLFDSQIEPTAWLQGINPRFGSSGGGGGVPYTAQVLHLGGMRFAASLYVQSAADGAFYGPRWTWNNTGGATYFENIKIYVGTKPPWQEKVSAVALKGIRDEIDTARIKPLITLADDSCGISSNQFQPSPGLDMAKFFGVGTKFQNLATPGNTLVQSASTAGLLPIHVNVTSAVIPASTAPVAITSWDYDPITSNSPQNPDYDPYAYLCGVLGRLSADAFTGNSPSAGHLFFTPVTAPTWPIDVPNGSKLILRASRKRKGGLTLFPLSSVNGVGGFGNNAVTFADAVFAANDPNTIAGFCGLTPSPYGTGASTLTALAGKSYIGRCYNPNIMSAATVAEAMSLFGWTWTGTENADWLAGNIGIPGSMRIVADGFHPYTDVAAYVLAKNHFTSSIVTSYLEGWA